MKAWQVKHYSEVDSTMDQAVRLLESPISKDVRIAIVADIQTKGRGKYDRIWTSPRGNLYTTLLLSPSVDLKVWFQLTFISSLALYHVLAEILDINENSVDLIKLKWPNDILLNGQKIAGLLLEISKDFSGHPWIAIGLGVNIKSTPQNQSATYLNHFKKQSCERVFKIFLEKFDALYFIWIHQGFLPIHEKWCIHMAYLEQMVKIKIWNHTYYGKIKGLNLNGHLHLQTQDTEIMTINTGDVFANNNDMK